MKDGSESSSNLFQDGSLIGADTMTDRSGGGLGLLDGHHTGKRTICDPCEFPIWIIHSLRMPQDDRARRGYTDAMPSRSAPRPDTDTAATPRQFLLAGHAIAVAAALPGAAVPTDRCFFEGVLPAKEGARRNRINELARIGVTLVLFESGARVRDCLRDLAEILGSRDIAICREMTKLHEDIRRFSLSDAA